MDAVDELGTGQQLAALVRRYRQERGLTQEELAERAGPGLSVNTIRNIERGGTRPYRHTVEVLAEALALTADERAALLAARVGTRRPARQIPARTYRPAWCNRPLP